MPSSPKPTRPQSPSAPSGQQADSAPLGTEFLRRVHFMSLILAAILGAVGATRISGSFGLGFFAFAVWSTANLWALQWLLGQIVRPAGADKGRLVLALLVKIPLVYAVGALLALRGGFPASAIFAGFSLPFAVIVLKVLGRILSGKSSLPRFAALSLLLLLAAPAFAQHGDEHADEPQATEEHAEDPHAAEDAAHAEDEAHATEGEHGEADAHHGEADAHGAEGEHGEGEHHGHHLELPHSLMILKEWGLEEDSATYHFVHVFENTFFAVLAGSVVCLFAVFAYRRRSEFPGRVQAAFEMVLEMIEGLASSMMGPKYGRHYTPFIATIFVYLLAMNYSGLIPFGKASTSTFLNNISIAICVFLYVQYTGIKRNGLGGYLHHLAGSPKDVVGWALSPLLFALELFGEFIKPVSLSLRLFGNIFGEDMLLAVFALLGVVALSGINSPIGIPFHLPFLFLSLLLGLIQALVFSLLTTVYLSLMLPHDEHH